VQLVGADRVAGRHQLDLAGLVLEVGEVEAAVAALAEDPPGDVDDPVGLGAGGDPAKLLPQRRRGGVAIEADGVQASVRLDAAGARLTSLAT
jgi:hypothetical protein